MRTVYRGVPFYKSPFDISLYLELLHRLAPRTVIEIGSKFGGSALWFADMLSADGISGQILSIDLEPPTGVVDSRITFIRGDASALAAALTPAMLARPHPWLVVEDSSHHYAQSRDVLEFFHPLLEPGDYIVVEDGVVHELSGDHYRAYDNGPNRAVSDFVNRHPDQYEIDEALCDRFGRNVTYNPNAWLRRTEQPV